MIYCNSPLLAGAEGATIAARYTRDYCTTHARIFELSGTTVPLNYCTFKLIERSDTQSNIIRQTLFPHVVLRKYP